MRSSISPPNIATLIFLTALSVVAGNMFLPSLADMARFFGVEYAAMSLAISLYLAVTGVLQLIVGPLSDRFGRRPLLIGAMAVFALTSLGCALADDITEFLVFRVLQGAVATGSALAMVIVRDQYAPQEAARKVALVAMAMAVGPMIGPMIGGVLDELHGWRAIFYAYAILGLFASRVCCPDTRVTNTTPSSTFASVFPA